MKPKLIKTSFSEYIPGVFSGKNECGYHPIGDRVVVLVDQPADQSTGGIYITEDTKEKMTLAAETGVIIEMGDGAFMFNNDRTTKVVGRKPKPGDHVYILRYSGQVMMGDDGQLYRVMDDTCIAAVKTTEIAIKE